MLPVLISRSFSVLSSRISLVSGLIFKPLIYFELISVSSVR